MGDAAGDCPPCATTATAVSTGSSRATGATADKNNQAKPKPKVDGSEMPRDRDQALVQEGDQSARGPYAHPGRFDCLEDEETIIQSTYVTDDPANPIAYKEYRVQDAWTLMTHQKRTQQLFEGLNDTGKRRQLRLLQEEETRERKSILIYEVPHSDLGADYELTEVQRAWPVIDEISTKNMGNKGCDIKITDIKGGRRLWEWKGDERCTCKPIKLEFNTREKAEEAMMAFRNAGMFGKRVLSKYGLFKATGKRNTDKKTRKRMYKTYVYPSSTKAEREAIRAQNMFSKTEFAKDKKDSHQFRKDTALDFSKFKVIDGRIRPKEELTEQTLSVTVNNPKYKPWFKRFSSNTIPEKITIPLNESAAADNAPTRVTQKRPKKRRQSRVKNSINPTTPQIAKKEGGPLPRGAPSNCTKMGAPKGSRAKTHVESGTLRRSSRLGDLRTKNVDGDQLAGPTEVTTGKGTNRPTKMAQKHLAPVMGSTMAMDILNEVIGTVIASCPLVEPSPNATQMTQMTPAPSLTKTAAEFFKLFDAGTQLDVVGLDANKPAKPTPVYHTPNEYTQTIPSPPGMRMEVSPDVGLGGIFGLFDAEMPGNVVVMEAGKLTKLTELAELTELTEPVKPAETTKVNPTDHTQGQAVVEAQTLPRVTAGTVVAMTILEEVIGMVIMEAKIKSRHDPGHIVSGGSSNKPRNITPARHGAVAAAAAAKAKAAEVAAADSFDFWTGVLRTHTAANTVAPASVNTVDDNTTFTHGAGNRVKSPSVTIADGTNAGTSEDTDAKTHTVTDQGDQGHLVDHAVDVQCETVDKRVCDLEQEQEQELYMFETEAKEAAADANMSISRAVAAVRAAMDDRRSDFEAKAEEAKVSTRSSVYSIAAASRAVRNAGEAMGVDLKLIKKPKNKVIEVKHWGDVTPIVDLKRDPVISRTPTGAANNAPGEVSTTQQGPPSHNAPHEAIIKLPTRLKRGKGKRTSHGRPFDQRTSDEQAEAVIQQQLLQLEEAGRAEIGVTLEAPWEEQADRFLKATKRGTDKRMGTVTISSKKRRIRKNSRKDKDTMETCFYIRRKVCPIGIECPHHHWDDAHDAQTHMAAQNSPFKPKTKTPVSTGRRTVKPTEKKLGPRTIPALTAGLPGFTSSKSMGSTTSSTSDASSMSTASLSVQETRSVSAVTGSTAAATRELPALVSAASTSVPLPAADAEASNKRKGSLRAAKELARSKSKCTTITISGETLAKLKDKRRQ